MLRVPVGVAFALALVIADGDRSQSLSGTAPSWHAALAAVPHDWTRFGWDAGRSNASPDPTGLSIANLASLERQQVRLEGTVDASPIYLSGVVVNDAPHDVSVVTTTFGKTIAVDGGDGAILWTYTPGDYASWAGSYQITNASPVADPGRQFLYAASPDGFIQKLSIADGGLVWRTAITLLPRREKIAASLNFFNGRVVATTGGYVGDAPPYQGHIALLDGATGRLERVWNSLCSDSAGLIDPPTCPESLSAIWGRAGAVIDSATGNIFVATGNGRWDRRIHWGDAVLEFDPGLGRLIGNYTPANTDQQDVEDLDVGSTSPVLLGDGYILQGGKDGQLRLLSIAQMEAEGVHRGGGELQAVSTPSGGELFTAPAVLHAGRTAWVFVADNAGTAGWRFDSGRLFEQWRNPNAGTSPVVAGGLVYVYDPRGALRVYEPDTGREVITLACGRGHWNSPIVVDGRIALPEGSANGLRFGGVLDIWRLPGR